MKNQIIIPDPKKVENIIKNLSQQGYKNLHILADFDRTITKAFTKGKKEVSSTISILRKENYLKRNYSQKAYALFDKYHPIEIDPTICLEDRRKQMESWWEEHSKLLIDSNLNIKDIEKAAKSDNIQIRHKAVEIFQLLHNKNVPTIIISASGLGVESITETLKHHHLYSANTHVISNQFIWDEQGYAIDFIKPLIHTFNKTETILKNFPVNKLVENRKNVILLGDSTGDVGMIDGFDYNNLLKIGFLNYEVEKNLQEFKNAFDVILTHDAPMDYIYKILLNFTS